MRHIRTWNLLNGYNTIPRTPLFFFFFFNATATTEIYTLSLHDALPISLATWTNRLSPGYISAGFVSARRKRSEEHTSELQSRRDLVCRLLLEKKKPVARYDRKSKNLNQEPGQLK